MSIVLPDIMSAWDAVISNFSDLWGGSPTFSSFDISWIKNLAENSLAVVAPNLTWMPDLAAPADDGNDSLLNLGFAAIVVILVLVFIVIIK